MASIYIAPCWEQWAILARIFQLNAGNNGQYWPECISSSMLGTVYNTGQYISSSMLGTVDNNGQYIDRSMLGTVDKTN